MPTYEYRCTACGHAFEKFQSITAAPIKTCPSCNAEAAQRQISGGAGFIFKGGGFYETDYRSEAYKKSAEADKAPSADAKSGDAKPAETKAAESKPSEPAPAAPKSEPAAKPPLSKPELSKSTPPTPPPVGG